MYTTVVANAKIYWETRSRYPCKFTDLTEDQLREGYDRVIAECAKFVAREGWSIESDTDYIIAISSDNARMAYIAKMAHWWRKRSRDLLMLGEGEVTNPVHRLPIAYAKVIEQLYLTSMAAMYDAATVRRVAELTDMLDKIDPIDGNGHFTKEIARAIWDRLEGSASAASVTALSFDGEHVCDERSVGRLHTIYFRRNETSPATD